jgi:diguanylate cyclase (GGDEF)-like protein/PAS domain S-box-containing protein
MYPAATAQPLHEVRRIQAERDDSPTHYFDLYDLAPIAYCTVSESGLILQVNLSAARLLGVERGALIRQPWSRFIVREDQDGYNALRKQSLADGTAQSGELRMVRRGGERFWVQLTLNSAPQTEAAPVLRIVFSDISERKRAEEAVRKKKEFFQLIAENIGDFIAVLDLDGRRIYNSPSYAQVFGADRDLRGSDSFAEIHPEDQARVRQVFRETVLSGIGRQIHYRILMADGTVREMESTGNVIRDGHNQIAQVVVASRDVTERRSLEARMEQLASHDDLTQLPNRRLLSDRLHQAMAASARRAAYAALIFVDLDNFKLLNDTHGHQFGDSLLIEAANRLKNCVREIDTVARFGGDEYVVVISELDAAYTKSRSLAETVAEKIRAALAQPYLLKIGLPGSAPIAIEHQCSASIGVVLFIDHQATQDDILKRADAAMYEAKVAGRNSIRFYEANS